MHHLTLTDQQTPFHIAIQLPNSTLKEAHQTAIDLIRLFPLKNYYISIHLYGEGTVKTLFRVLVKDGKKISLYDSRG